MFRKIIYSISLFLTFFNSNLYSASSSSFQNDDEIERLFENHSKKNILLGNKPWNYIGTYIYYLEDKNHDFSIEKIQNLKLSKLFKKYTKNNINLGFSSSIFWFRFTLEELPSVEKNNNKYLLEFGNSHLDYISVFIIDTNNKMIEIHSGDLLPFKNRPIQNRHVVIPINFGSGKMLTIYVKVNTQGSYHVPMKILTREQLAYNIYEDNLEYGIIFGMLLIMIFYHLFLFLIVKDKNYIFYVAYTISLFLLHVFINGFGYQYILPNSPYWNDKIIMLLVLFPNITILVFTLVFLQIKLYTPLIYRILIFVLFIFLLSLGLPFLLSHLNSIKIITAIAFVNPVILLVTGIINLIKKNRAAKYFVLAWSMIFAGSIIYILSRTGFLPFNYFTEKSLIIGSMLNIIFLSLSIGDRFRLIEEEYEALKYKALQDRMKPHFLFNALTTLNVIIKKNVQLAEKSIITLSNIYRFLTDFNSKELIPLKDELTFIQNYIEFEKLSYFDDLSVSFKQNENITGIYIPPLCLQPLVENAIVHGLRSKKGKKYLSIEVRIDKSLLTIEILDNGLGLGDTSTVIRSIANIRERLSFYYRNSSLSVSNRAEDGVRSFVKIQL